MEHGEAFEWADTICQAHNANTCKNPIKFLTLWKEKQKRKTEESKGKKKMASNRSINLNRNQKIVSSLCKHLSLDPKILLDDAKENDIKTLYLHILKSSGAPSNDNDEVMKWIAFAESFPLDSKSCSGVLSGLNGELAQKSVLLGNGLKPSEADVIVFSVLHPLLRNRSKQVLDHLNILKSLCLVLGMDSRHIAGGIHSTLNETEGTKDISNHTIEKLAAAIQSLREVKIQRMQRVEAEVLRLEQLKSSKMKELVIKKRLELEEICRQTHMVTEALSIMEDSVEAMESGAVDPMYLLEQIELQIARVKEEASCRKEVLEKVEKWIVACQEESWLEEYNRDENRYNAGRGAHLTLKRAEKARALVNKIPAMMEALTSKIKAWEEQRGTGFSYDGERLLSMLEQYSMLRQEKEQERQRQKVWAF